MSLYTPRHFLPRREELAAQLIRDYPFATLITTVDGGEPHLSHIPLLLADGALHGHLARVNPHVAALARGRTVAVFQGPHAYVSPRWYVDPAQHVPTWNYAVVHVHGTPQLLDMPGAIAHVRAATAHFEQGAWTPDADKLARLAGGIVAFRLPLERVEAKVKMSQNRTPADRAGVIAALRASGRADDAAVADWIPVDD